MQLTSGLYNLMVQALTGLNAIATLTPMKDLKVHSVLLLPQHVLISAKMDLQLRNRHAAVDLDAINIL